MTLQGYYVTILILMSKSNCLWSIFDWSKSSFTESRQRRTEDVGTNKSSSNCNWLLETARKLYMH